MSERCSFCGRPFATTAHEQALHDFCQDHQGFGCLRARIAKLETESAARLAALQRIARAVGVEGSLVVAEQVEYRISKLTSANAALVDLCEEYQAQWGDEFLATKWGLKELLSEIKKGDCL